MIVQDYGTMFMISFSEKCKLCAF